MFASVLLASANIVAASPTVSIPWFVFDDYPMDAIRLRTEGMSEIELVVAPTGQPVACSVTRSTGNKILDRQACNVSMRRAKFKPARNAALQPVYGTYRSQIQWRLDPDEWKQIGPAPMREIILNRLPAGMNSPFYLEYALMVDGSGQASQCAPVIADYPDLAKASCAMLLKDVPAAPVALADGAATPAVRSVWVAYSL